MKTRRFFRFLLRVLLISVLAYFLRAFTLGNKLLTATVQVVLLFAIAFALESIVEFLQKKYRNKVKK